MANDDNNNLKNAQAEAKKAARAYRDAAEEARRMGDDSDETAAFFVRKKRFVASAGLVKIALDGNEIGKLGVGEMERISIEPGSHTARVTISNLLQAGIGGDAVAFNAEEGKAYYFIVDYDQGLFTGKWSITETSKNGFTKALN